MRDERDESFTTDATSTPLPRVRRLPAIDCTTPLPIKFIKGPDYPSWLTAPDRQADEHTPAVSNAYLDDEEEQRDAESDGLNAFRGFVSAVFFGLLFWAAVYVACRLVTQGGGQ